MNILARQRALSINGQGNNRKKNDFYPTPSFAIEALLKVKQFTGDILEPACGTGSISKILESNLTNKVYSSDLFDYGFGQSGCNFLTDEYAQVDNIITNPPFKISTPFMVKAQQVAKHKIAFFLKLTALDGIIRYRKIWSNKDFPLSKVYVFSKRVNFDPTIKSGGFISFAWFIWEKDCDHEPYIRWL